ncbi:NAD(P)H-dependent oxidoreductase [Desulfitobacterium sp. Sab5]|uniref:NAD(P)H-dependent oxidoreductase n=1 Tax=Desulfitobacterium nosdiversum TaxID=3375356 RepID=UPI003CF9AD4E
MQAFIISDQEYQNEEFTRLHDLVSHYLSEKGMPVEETRIAKDDLAFCKGCFGCWVKKPGECVINDAMAQINQNFIKSDLTVYLCPVVFGQFSANIKNALDRWIPNILPFFEIRPDGSTMHPARYSVYPRQLMIGYGKNLSPEDTGLFLDITAKHRRNVDVLIYQGNDFEITRALAQIEPKKVGDLL